MLHSQWVRNIQYASTPLSIREPYTAVCGILFARLLVARVHLYVLLLLGAAHFAVGINYLARCAHWFAVIDYKQRLQIKSINNGGARERRSNSRMDGLAARPNPSEYKSRRCSVYVYFNLIWLRRYRAHLCTPRADYDSIFIGFRSWIHSGHQREQRGVLPPTLHWYPLIN